MILQLATVAGIVLLTVAVVLATLRARHDREMQRVWRSLQVRPADGMFDPASIADLPEPARRYLRHAIAPGTPLARCVVIGMDGLIGLRPGAAMVPFTSDLLIAPPDGLIWKATAGSAVLRLSADDRYVAGEAAIRWPQRGARWEAIDDRAARVRLRIGSEELAPVLFVAPDGRLERLEMQRWAPDAPPGYVLWRADRLTAERSFGGYTLATAGRVTKYAGTPRAHAFFEFTITDMRFQ